MKAASLALTEEAERLSASIRLARIAAVFREGASPSIGCGERVTVGRLLALVQPLAAAVRAQADAHESTWRIAADTAEALAQDLAKVIKQRDAQAAAHRAEVASLLHDLSWLDGAARPERETLAALSDEVKRTRAKFPGNRFMLAALTEEVGEVARALLQRKGSAEVRREAIQVAAVALRIVEEGDASFDDITNAEAKP